MYCLFKMCILEILVLRWYKKNNDSILWCTTYKENLIYSIAKNVLICELSENYIIIIILRSSKEHEHFLPFNIVIFKESLDFI